jgi:hypothetical protein
MSALAKKKVNPDQAMETQYVWITHSPNQNCSDEFHDRRNQHGLHECQRPRGHGRGEGVGDIVGTDTPSVQEGKEYAQGKDVVELVKGKTNSHPDGLLSMRTKSKESVAEPLWPTTGMAESFVEL